MRVAVGGLEQNPRERERDRLCAQQTRWSPCDALQHGVLIALLPGSHAALVMAIPILEPDINGRAQASIQESAARHAEVGRLLAHVSHDLDMPLLLNP